MLDKVLLDFDDSFLDGCIVGNHVLSQKEIFLQMENTRQYIAELIKIKKMSPTKDVENIDKFDCKLFRKI